MHWRKLVLALALCVARPAHAEEASPRAQASEEFRRGVRLTESGDLNAAVQAFLSAYEKSPHYAVLYNLGQAYVSLGKPVEAVSAFERFLREGAESVDPARRRDVEALLASQRERIGYVSIEVRPADAEVFVNGEAVLRRDEKLGIAAGRHVIAARKSGYASRVESVELAAGQSIAVSLELETTPTIGQVGVVCALPAVEVSVDGVKHGVTPFDQPLIVPTGSRAIRFARPGYRTAEMSVTVREGKGSRVTCPVAFDFRGVRPGSLKVTPSEPFAGVSIDGTSVDQATLPPGPHSVRVRRSGYRTWTRVITVEPGRSHTVAVILEPTPDRVAELQRRSRTQRNMAIGVGVGGVVLAGVSVGLFAWNSGRYDDWRQESDSLGAAIAESGTSASRRQKESELRTRAADIQRVDDIATAAAISSAAALVTAGVLWLTSGGD